MVSGVCMHLLMCVCVGVCVGVWQLIVGGIAYFSQTFSATAQEAQNGVAAAALKAIAEGQFLLFQELLCDPPLGGRIRSYTSSVHLSVCPMPIVDSTSSSAVAERPHDSLCPSVVSFKSVKPGAESFIIVT